MTDERADDGQQDSSQGDDRPDFDDAFRERTDAPNPIVHVLRAYGGAYPRLLGVGLLTAALLPLLGLVQPYLLGVVVDVVAGQGRLRLPGVSASVVPTDLRGQLLVISGLLVGTYVLESLLEGVDSLVWARLRHDVEHDLRVDAYDAAQRLGMSFFTSARTGDVMSVLNDDMGELQEALPWFKELFQLAVFGAGMALVMVWMNPPLAAVVLSVGIPMAAFVFAFRRRISRRYTDLRRVAGTFNARLEGSIGGMATVKANAAEADESERVATRSREYRDAALDVNKLWAGFAGVIRLLLQGSMLLVLVVGGWIVLHGPPVGVLAPVTAGTFVTFFFYARRFTDRMKDTGRAANEYESVAAAGRRVFGLMNYPARLDDLPDRDSDVSFAGRVRYDDVTFRYPGTEQPAIRDVSVEIEPGEFVGIVGPTGAGKTTLCSLLVRFYDPDTGSISIDGTDLRELSLADLRSSIGYVSQEPFLFDATVRENIAYGSPDAADDDVAAAARSAQAHEFVTDLVDGYDTEVGERGVKLSGGQRQRLVIARELLRDPDVLILDEATSHVDTETEALIQDSLGALIADRTTIAIAHRLSTVRDADRILVVEDGTVAERGTHEELLAADGLYATLWSIHVGDSRELSPDAI